MHLGISGKGFAENTRYELHVALRRSRQTEGWWKGGGGRGGQGGVLKGDFSTHPVCDRFLTLTRRCQVYTLNHDITRAALRGDWWGDFRLFQLRSRDHIASLKTAKQRHLNRVPTSQAACHPPTEGSRDCDPAWRASRGLAGGFAEKSDVQTTRTRALQMHSNVIGARAEPSGV